MSLIVAIELPMPPRVVGKMQKRGPNAGKEMRIECNLNTINSDRLHFATRTWLMNYAVDWWIRQLSGKLPKMEAVRIGIDYFTSKSNWDLDNFDGFWRKGLGDALKESHPPRTITRGKNKGKIKTDRMRLGLLKEDFVPVIRGWYSDVFWRSGPEKIRVQFWKAPQWSPQMELKIEEPKDVPF